MIGVLLLALGVGLVARVAIRTRSLPLAVLAVSLAVFYGIRAVGIAAGLDEPYPEYLFTATDLGSALGRLGALALLFCVAVLIAYSALGGIATALAKVLPLPKKDLRLGPILTIMVATTVVAAMIGLYQLASHGGFSNAIYAAKSSREGGEALLRIPATLALVMACSTFYGARRLRDGKATGRTAQVVAGVCAVVAALSASVWGSRQFTVLAAAYLIGAPALAAFRHSRRGWLLRAMLVMGIVVGVGFGLRLYRDEALGGETAISEAQGNTFRQVSISVNGTTLDSSLLAVKDWPRKFSWRDGEDFVDGLWGAVPPSLRPVGLVRDTAGAEFHRIYEPDARNGWPIGAPTEWYINFGWIGVLIGGLLTGLVYRAITIGHQRSPMTELATVAALILTLVVFPLGLSSSSPNRLVIHAIPLLMLLGVLSLMSGGLDGGTSKAEREGSRAHAGSRAVTRSSVTRSRG